MGKPQPYEFRDAQEIVKNLLANKTVLAQWFAQRKESLEEIVRHSVGGNTFRSFRNMPERPSVVFRTWAMCELEDGTTIQSLKGIRSQPEYDKWLQHFTKKINMAWLKQMGVPMPFEPRRKLPSLLMKEIVLWTGLNESQRVRLVRYLHVPLDSYTLVGIRQCINAFVIPTTAKMGFMADETTYESIQGAIRMIAAKAKVPAIYFDNLAWNMKH